MTHNMKEVNNDYRTLLSKIKVLYSETNNLKGEILVREKKSWHF